MAGDLHDSNRAGRIGLAGEPVRRLGPLTIEPALRRIAHEDGREELVEPRVMQVLVALLRAEGGIVSRDDLVLGCWEGRIVGDDAINRVLSRLRRLAEGIGAGIFRVETLTRVGYRLVCAGKVAPGGAGRRRRSRPVLFAASAAALLVLLVAGLAWSARDRSIPTVALVSQMHGREGAAFAAGIAADLSRIAAGRAGDLSVVQSPTAADYIVGVSGERRGDKLHHELTLSGRASGELLWSIAFDRNASEIADLSQQVAVKLGDVLFCTLHGARGLDSTTLRLFLSFCDHRHDMPSIADVDLLKQVAERAPGFARARAMLAATEADLGAIDEAEDHRDTPERRALRAAALADLTRARSFNPALEEIYYAEARIDQEPHHWAERLAILDRGIADCPAAILYQAKVEDLMRVGRMKEAVDSARNAVAFDPTSPWARESLISALSYAGRIAESRAELEAAERLWPGSEMMRDVRYRFDLRYGDAANALRMLDQPGELSLSPPTEKAFLLARIDPKPAKIETALAVARPRGPAGIYPSLSVYVQMLGTFGRVREGFEAMYASLQDPFWNSGTFILFRPHMRSLWRDPRFIGFAAHLGLADYWIRSGHWPDFCSDPDLTYDCRTEAQRLLHKMPAAPARI